MNNRRVVATAGLLLVNMLAVPVHVSGGGVTGGGTDGPQPQAAVWGPAVPVSDCRTIDAPGRYVLTQDITDSRAEECITIVASDVVFDGQGHTLDAREVAHQTEAIAAGYTDPPIENVTIKNLVVTDWTQGVGCRAIASDVSVENVTARRNGLEAKQGAGYSVEGEGYGIYVGDLTHNVTVSNSTIVGNSIGVFISNTSNNVIRNNVIRENTEGGVTLGGLTLHNRVVNNRIVANGGDGIFVRSQPQREPTRPTLVRGNALRGNDRGVVVRRSETVVSVVNNTFLNTTKDSITLTAVTGNVSIANNEFQHGDGNGIVLDATEYVLVRDNRIRSEGGTGILLTNSSTANVVRGNHIVGARHGLRITNGAGRILVRETVVAQSRTRAMLFDGAGNNTVTDVRVRGGYGIAVKSTGNRLRDLVVADTETYGIRLAGAPNTDIENVTIRRSGTKAFEAVGGATTVALRNLSLASGRVSLSGSTAVISPVNRFPTPPPEYHTIGVAVRVWNTVSASQSDSDTVLTVYYPPGATNVTLWRQTFNGTWAQFDDATAHPTRNAVSAAVPPDANLIVVPLSPTPLLTPTEPPLSTPTPAEPGFTVPGFGIVLALLALCMLVGIRARTMWS